MKIDNVTLINQSPKIETGKTGGKQAAEAPAKTDAGPSTQTHISAAAKDASGDIDQVRVAELREAIKDGRLEIDSERIADSLIASVRDMLGEDR